MKRKNIDKTNILFEAIYINDLKIPEQQIILPNNFDQDTILKGLMAIFTLLPHKLIEYL